MSLATAVFPSLAERAATGGREAVSQMVSQTLRFTLFLAVPASIGMLLLRDSIVATLLEHGAFDAAATRLFADALLFYSIGLFAHAAIEIVSRGFYVLGDTRTPVALAVASMLLNIVLSALLVGPMNCRAWRWRCRSRRSLSSRCLSGCSRVGLTVGYSTDRSGGRC